MTKNRKAKAAARALAQQTGLPYVAARALTQQTEQPDTATRTLEIHRCGATPETTDLGTRALPAGATPAQRALAEATWSAVAGDQQCRCSSSDCEPSSDCEHGATCGAPTETGPCTGRMIHQDRHAVALSDIVTAWRDVYECDTCGDPTEGWPILRDLPWGEATSDGRRMTYPGVRLTAYPDQAWRRCETCGEYEEIEPHRDRIASDLQSEGLCIAGLYMYEGLPDIDICDCDDCTDARADREEREAEYGEYGY